MHWLAPSKCALPARSTLSGGMTVIWSFESQGTEVLVCRVVLQLQLHRTRQCRLNPLVQKNLRCTYHNHVQDQSDSWQQSDNRVLGTADCQRGILRIQREIHMHALSFIKLRTKHGTRTAPLPAAIASALHWFESGLSTAVPIRAEWSILPCIRRFSSSTGVLLLQSRASIAAL